MADTRAFKLAAGYEDFGGGTFAYGGEGDMFDVGAALTPEGSDAIDVNKVIVTDDPQLANALADYAPLESTDVPAQPEKVVSKETRAEKSEKTPLVPVPDVAAEHGDE